VAEPDRRDIVISRLAAAGCVAPEEEAGAMLSAEPDDATLETWLRRREQGEPLAWIVGSTLFDGRRLRMEPGVYVPRPQSEGLARRAAAVLPADGTLLDLATGSGAVAAVAAALVPTAVVVGLDLSSTAARCARSNGVPAAVADLAAAPIRSASVDVVVAVAPYVPTDALRLLPPDVQRHEPRRALDGGADGLDLVRAAVRAAARVLRPGGWILLELGADQDVRLGPALTAAGFAEATTWTDDDGDLRGLAAALRTHP
jgi:release factor glutamine methyltransferase